MQDGFQPSLAQLFLHEISTQANRVPLPPTQDSTVHCPRFSELKHPLTFILNAGSQANVDELRNPISKSFLLGDSVGKVETMKPHCLDFKTSSVLTR